MPGCGPVKYTYPADQVPQAIEKICKEEFKTDVEAQVVGKNVGVLMFTDKLLDDSGQIDRDTHELMWKVMSASTRVALSTDLSLDFCTVVVRQRDDSDKENPVELLMIRSTEDTRRANADMFSTEETFYRTLLTPNKYQPEPQKPFDLEETKMENFLAKQNAQRLQVNLAAAGREEGKNKSAEELSEAAEQKHFIMTEGVYDLVDGKKTYHFSVISMTSQKPKDMMLAIFKTVSDILKGYNFTDYEQVEIYDYFNRQKLSIDKESLLRYQKKKISDEEILAKYVTESKSIQEAFQIFGFSPPPVGTAKSENTASVAATTTP